MTDEDVPATLTLDEAFRAAFYLVRDYARRGHDPNGDIPLLLDYLWSDPARWDDWRSAIASALTDGGLANPDHEGVWQIRPAMPY